MSCARANGSRWTAPSAIRWTSCYGSARGPASRRLRCPRDREVIVTDTVGFIRDLLAIERLRLGERLQTVEAVEPGLDAVPVPTLLLQPLVENAIKHGVANLPEGGMLRISVSRQEALVEIGISNTMDPEADPPQGLGLGLKQVQRRLQSRYGLNFIFDAAAAADTFSVMIRFPMEDPDG